MKSVTITISIPVEMGKRFRQIATEEQRTVSELLL